MVEATKEFIVETPRPIQSDASDSKADVREIGGRVGPIEGQIASLATRFADLSSRRDRRGEPMKRIMRRLDLTAAAH